MSLSRILQQVNSKGKISEKIRNNDSPKESESEKPKANIYTYENGQTKVVDPVVARLKEKRRLEKEKNGVASKKTKSNPKAVARTAQPKKIPPTKIESNRQVSPTKTVRRSKPKFNDLMKKASQIDQSKLSISIKSKSKSPETALSRSLKDRKMPNKGDQPRVEKRNYGSSSAPEKTKSPSRAPIPIRKPSSVLRQKLSKSRQNPRNDKTARAMGNISKGQSTTDYDEDEYDDELDSFVVSDEDPEAQQEAADYDRDEIWAIFNRGKKRSHYDALDYDSADDMEATGGEIFEEEMKSKRSAVLEDIREMEEEKRLAALKKAKRLQGR